MMKKENTNEPKRFELEREIKAPLTMFLFTVQDARLAVEIPMDVKAIIAYDMTSALNMVKKDYPENRPVIIAQRGAMKVKRIIDVLDLKPETTNLLVDKPKIEKEKEVEPPQLKMTKQQFINNCMLIADQFITEKRDQTSLKRILNKIKVNEHIQTKSKT